MRNSHNIINFITFFFTNYVSKKTSKNKKYFCTSFHLPFTYACALFSMSFHRKLAGHIIVIKFIVKKISFFKSVDISSKNLHSLEDFFQVL